VFVEPEGVAAQVAHQEGDDAVECGEVEGVVGLEVLAECAESEHLLEDLVVIVHGNVVYQRVRGHFRTQTFILVVKVFP